MERVQDVYFSLDTVLRKSNKQESFSLTDFIYPLLAYVSTQQRPGR